MHKPDQEAEAFRIRQAGGRVQRGRINAVLAVSRAFGDYDFKQNAAFPAGMQQVVAEPACSVEPRSAAQDEFILLGCDGWKGGGGGDSVAWSP